MGKILKFTKPTGDTEFDHMLIGFYEAIEQLVPVNQPGIMRVELKENGLVLTPELPPAGGAGAPWYHPFRIFSPGENKFRVRSGIVSGWRPKFFALPTDGDILTSRWTLLNNFEPACRGVRGTDVARYTHVFNYDEPPASSYSITLAGPPPAVSTLTYEDVTVTDLEVDYFGATNSVTNFILPDTYVSGDWICNAGFFLKFTDGADAETEPEVRVGCRLFNPIASLGVIYPFPAAADEIPIGMVMIDAAGKRFVEQFHYNHIWRHQPVVGVATGLSASGFGQAGIYRGDYDDDSLNGQMMYPGDLVRRSTSEIYEGFANLYFYETYQAESYFRCSGSPESDSRFNLVTKAMYNADGFP